MPFSQEKKSGTAANEESAGDAAFSGGADSSIADAATRPGAPQTAPLADDAPENGTRPLAELREPTPPAHQASPRGFAAAALRDIGRVRSMNQDSVFALTTTMPREGNDLPLGLFIVADGMGGHDGGEVASRMAVSTVARHVLADLVVPALFDGVTAPLQTLMVEAVQAANRAIWEHARAIGSDMGTTCTAVLLLGHTLYIGHVGDSRAYLRRPDSLELLTTDHSAVGRLIQVGQITPDEAREHPMRSQLYRTVGQQPEVLVDFERQPIGDATHLLLGSDGLWGMLDEATLAAALDQNVWPHDACRALIAGANEAGGEDNISAVVVTLPGA